MEWNQNSNGAVAPPQSQQYLLPTTSSNVANGQSQFSSVHQHSIVQHRSFNSINGPLLQNLLKANTNDEISQIQQAALGKYRSSKPNRSTNQMTPSIHISSYKTAQEPVSIVDNINAIPNTVGSNYRKSTYVNTVHQTPQQPLPSVAIAQQFGGNGYNTSVQQQNSQALQNYQSTVTYTYPQQNMVYNSVRPPTNAVQMPYQQMSPNVPPSNMYSLQSGVPGLYISSQKLPAEVNISTPMQNCRSNQTFTSPSLTNCRALAPNMLPHVPQQQISVPQLQTLQQLDGNSDCSNQSQQRQTVQNVFINNTSQISSTAAAHMPPSYTQATANTSNIINASMNQNERQKVIAPNIQQPAQSGNPPPVQGSIGDGQSRDCERTVLQQRKEDLMKLLLFYRNIRQKYELLNRENNILRQRLQASTSQENAGPPPLLSSLPTAKPQANCAVVGQQNVTRAVPVQNSVQISYLGSFHSQNVQDNVVNAPNQAGIPPNLSLQENAAPLNQMLKVDNGNILRYTNYSVFDGGQANVVNGSTSALQSHGLETNKACQQVTLREFSGQTNSDHFGSSPNPTNGNKLKNGHGLHSLDEPASVTQSLNPACPEKNSYGRLSSYTTGLTGNGQVTSLSQEAIEASLPLWKTVPQSTNKCSETQLNLSPVDSSLAAFRLLDELSGPTNEVSSTTPVQKQDSAVPNQANPQIAIVSPLVQSKESLEEYQLSKVRIQGPDIENTTINGLNSHESECFSKILQALESLGANTMSNIESSRSKEPSVASRGNLDSTLPSDTGVSSQIEMKTSSDDIEIVDDRLQISGICTLVEGNTFYNSSIAMMFNETSNNTALPCNDLREDHSKAEDAVCISKEPCSTSPKAVPIAIKSEPVDDDEVAIGQTIKDDLQCNQIPCSDKQANQHTVSVQQDSCCDLESSTIADQLTELLTEFPYGIKNYMSENNKLESTNGTSAKVKDKPVLKASAAPEEFESVQGKEIDTKPERVPSRSVNLQDVVAMVSKQLLDLKPPADKLPSEVQKPITKDVHEDSKAAMGTCLDDGFEILSNSPASDIHITLLDQDEISTIFPNEYVESEKCNETKFEGLLACIKTEESEPESNSPNKDLTDPTDNGTDKNLFCCLFSWLNLTNKNAPKCKCKQLESSTIKPPKLSNNDSLIISNIKIEPSLQSPKPTLPDLPKPSNVGFVFLQPNDRPPKLDLVDSDHEEIPQPMDKPPKLERMVSEVEGVQKSSPILIPQDISLKRTSPIENFQSVKDSLKNNPVNHERSLTPCVENGESTLKNSKIQSLNKCKSQSSRKSEKLIVKTDFLKTKHPDKEKGDDQEKTVTNVASSKSGSQSGFSKKSPVKHGKRPQREERVELHISARQSDQSNDHQAVSSYNAKKSSPGTDVSSKTRGVRKCKEKESHFEKTRNVLSVHEYLERKRELYKKRTETRIETRESLLDEKQFEVERPSEMSGNPQLDLKRPLSPAKTNVTSKEKKRCSGTPKVYNQKDSLQSGGPYEAGHRKRKDSHKGQRKKPENKTQNRSSNKTQNRASSKDKIYLSPCVSSRRASYDGINLAKLQIRHSPDKPKYIERRRSFESSCLTKPSNSAVKNMVSPKMLEFKLCPEFAQGSPTTQDQAREAMDPKPKSVVEGIKSSKEAWCNSIPFKKRKVDNIEGQGLTKSPTSGESAPIYKPLEKNTSRPQQDSRTTFNVFKQMYQEQRSKSLDLSQGNS